MLLIPQNQHQNLGFVFLWVKYWVLKLICSVLCLKANYTPLCSIKSHTLRFLRPFIDVQLLQTKLFGYPNFWTFGFQIKTFWESSKLFYLLSSQVGDEVHTVFRIAPLENIPWLYCVPLPFLETNNQQNEVELKQIVNSLQALESTVLSFHPTLQDEVYILHLYRNIQICSAILYKN